MPLELDHLFYMVEDEAQAEAWASALRLEESYRRQHPGQGTTNICCCFNNAYLEFLWVDDPQAVASDVSAPLAFAARSAWGHLGTSPIGISIRHGEDEALPFETWQYTPSYLPEGVTISMARDSDDARQPLLFAPPGGCRPDSWTGDRAVPLNVAELVSVEIGVPAGMEPSTGLIQLAELGLIQLTGGQLQWGLTLTLHQPGDPIPTELTLPIW